jgi:hypothetical protein
MVLPFPLQSFTPPPSPLCARCAALDLYEGLWSSSSKSFQLIAHICPVVQSESFRFRILPRYDSGRRPPHGCYELIALSVDPTHFVLLGDNTSIVLWLVPSHKERRRNFTLAHFQGGIIFQGDEDNAETLKCVRPLIDFNTVKSWLLFCFETHRIGCVSPWEAIAQLQVIDCVSRLIVLYPAGAGYVTLSYVWGKGVGQDLGMTDTPTSTHDTLPENLPETIRRRAPSHTSHRIPISLG